MLSLSFHADAQLHLFICRYSTKGAENPFYSAVCALFAKPRREKLFPGGESIGCAQSRQHRSMA